MSRRIKALVSPYRARFNSDSWMMLRPVICQRIGAAIAIIDQRSGTVIKLKQRAFDKVGLYRISAGTPMDSCVEY